MPILKDHNQLLSELCEDFACQVYLDQPFYKFLYFSFYFSLLLVADDRKMIEDDRAERKMIKGV